jgi:hypothetical protein
VPHQLLLADPETAKDVLTFMGRARRITDEGVRLQAADGVLALTTAVLSPVTLFDQTPTILAMRIVHADPELQCDVVVDELATTDDAQRLTLPEMGLSPAWVGVAPPRGQWLPASTVPASVIAQRAQWGISAVARGAAEGSGEEAVRALRAAIWGAPDDDLDGLPRGVAFAADAMGFIAGEEQISVMRSGRWTRLAFRRGHVLARGPVASGLTGVRDTGPSV